MNTDDSPRTLKPLPAARAEAAAWVARLHGPHRDAATEASWRRWMSESPSHAQAFELVTDTWEKAQALRRRPLERLGIWELPGFRIRFSHAVLAAVLIAALAMLGTVLLLSADAR
jgi:ferric-dicitrate binding protein FerR (iron transport regulator)